MERETVFERLRYQTSWFRRAGRAALRTSKTRADFDRVRVAPPAKRKPTVKSKNVPAAAAANTARDGGETK